MQHVDLNTSAAQHLPSRGVPIAWIALGTLLLFNFASPTMSGKLDTDFWWHLLYAQWMFDHHSIAPTDWLTWTFAGEPYMVTQWLGQLLVGGAHRFAGLNGTALLTWFCASVTTILVFSAARRSCKNEVIALLATLALNQSLWYLVARPQMFGVALMAGLVLVFEHVRETGWNMKRYAMVCVIMALWVNAHGSYIMGLLYTAVFLVSAWARMATENGEGEPRWLEATLRSRGTALALIAGTAATLANPHTWHAWSYVLEISRYNSTTSGVISEWVPTHLGNAMGANYIMAAVALTSVALMMSFKRHNSRPDYGDILMYVAMLMLGMMALRQSFFAAIAITPVLARAANNSSLYKLLDAQLPARLRQHWAYLAFAFAAGLGFAHRIAEQRGVDQSYEARFPVRAAAFVEEHKISGKLFNEISSGGWWAYNTHQKTMIDGRLDLFKDPFFFEYYYARNGAPGWKTTIDRLDPDYFVLQNQSALRQILLASGRYALVNEDPTHSVVLKRATYPADFIAAHEVRPGPFEIFDKEGNLKATMMGW